MDKKSLEKVVGQDVALVWRRPRNRTPWSADRVKLVAVGVAYQYRGRNGVMAQEGDDKPGTGRLILVEDEKGDRRRVESRDIYSTWDDFVALKAREKVAEDDRRVRAEFQRAQDEAFAKRFRKAAKALGLSESEWDCRSERRYGDEYRVSIDAGVKLVELLESLAVAEYEAAQER